MSTAISGFHSLASLDRSMGINSSTGRASAAENGEPAPITEPYALFVYQNLEIDAQGRRWTVPAWAKDLALHLDYITDLTLVSPARRVETRSSETVSLDEPPFDRIQFIDLPFPVGWGQAIRTMPLQVRTFWRAMSGAAVVHCGYAGWPFVHASLAVPMARLRGKFILANVESSFWRATAASRWIGRLRGAFSEWLVRRTIPMADLKILTSKRYLEELLPPGAPGAHVTPATWLNEEWLISDKEAASAWERKTGPIRLLFVGRLIPEKGVPQLIAATEAAVRAGADIRLTILHPRHETAWKDEYLASARAIGSEVVTILDEIPYGDEYMRLIREFDAVMVPSLSDEQPRIVYDAFSQAVPILGSATGGIRELAQEGVCARLTPPGDVPALTEQILWAASNRPALREMGYRGRASVQNATHKEMHRYRHRLLREAIDARRPRASERPGISAEDRFNASGMASVSAAASGSAS